MLACSLCRTVWRHTVYFGAPFLLWPLLVRGFHVQDCLCDLPRSKVSIAALPADADRIFWFSMFFFFCVRTIETSTVPGRGLPLCMPYSEGDVEMINSYLAVDLSMEGETSLSIVDIVIAHSPLYPVKCSQLPHWIFSSFLFGEVIIRSREFRQTTIPSL